jgi:hypothetical protein
MYRVHLSNITRTSGANRRREDLIHGREKVMRSDWFARLSETTRQRFFYNLLIELAAGQPERQLGFLGEAAFQSLSAAHQAVLWRQVGIEIFRHSGDLEQARRCFEQSGRIYPADRKTGMLYRVSKFGQIPLRGTIGAWNLVHRVSVALRGIGQSKPKPVPSALGPVKN